jgi:hypothetical protein
MKKTVLLGLMAFMFIAKGFAQVKGALPGRGNIKEATPVRGDLTPPVKGYEKVSFTNYTKKEVEVEVNYGNPSCKKNDKFSVAPGATASPSTNRGACLITWISGTGATIYKSSGTSYSRFGVLEIKGKLEVRRIDQNGKPLDN